MPKAVKYSGVRSYTREAVRVTICVVIKSLLRVRTLFYFSTPVCCMLSPVCCLLFSIDDEIVFEHSGAGI
jgi:hypothetical protein